MQCCLSFSTEEILTCCFAGLWRSNDAQSDGDHRSGDVLGQIQHGVLREFLSGLGGGQEVDVLPIDTGVCTISETIHWLNHISIIKLQKDRLFDHSSK